MNNKKIVVNHEVLYAETDMMGIVHHRNYLVWMEMGRLALLKSVNIDIKHCEDMGYYLPVVEVWTRYKNPAVFGDTVAVETRLKEWGKSIFTFRSVVRTGDRILNIGEVKCAIIDKDRKIIDKVPEFLVEPIELLRQEVYSNVP